MKLISVDQVEITLDHLLFLVTMIKRKQEYGMRMDEDLQLMTERIEKEIKSISSRAICDTSDLFIKEKV